MSVESHADQRVFLPDDAFIVAAECQRRALTPEERERLDLIDAALAEFEFPISHGGDGREVVHLPWQVVGFTPTLSQGGAS